MKELTVDGTKTASQFENYYRWVEPDGGITVCLKLEAVDRLQLEALPSTESSSNAREEVGGILLGRTEFHEGHLVMFVDEFESVPCKHRNGPFYDLAARDAVNLE